jgi:hypothetical protein
VAGRFAQTPRNPGRAIFFLTKDLDGSETVPDFEEATQFPPIEENIVEILIDNAYKENTLQLSIRNYPIPIEKPREERPREDR